MGGDVGYDGIDVVVVGNDGRRRHVAGCSDDGRVVRFRAAELDERADRVLGVEWRPAVVQVDDGSSGHHVVGELGDLAERTAVLLVGTDQGCPDAGHFVADGVQRRVVGVRYGGVGHWLVFGVT